MQQNEYQSNTQVTGNRMCTYNWLTLFNWDEKSQSSRNSFGNPTGCSRDILHKAKGDYLDRVHTDQKVLEVIRRGRLVLVIRGQESQNQLKGPSGWKPPRSDGSHDGQAGDRSMRREADSRATLSHVVTKKKFQPIKRELEVGIVTARVGLLFLIGLMKRGIVADDGDDK